MEGCLLVTPAGSPTAQSTAGALHVLTCSTQNSTTLLGLAQASMLQHLAMHRMDCIYYCTFSFQPQVAFTTT